MEQILSAEEARHEEGVDGDRDHLKSQLAIEIRYATVLELEIDRVTVAYRTWVYTNGTLIQS